MKSVPYRTGQRWRLRTRYNGLEDTLVIGRDGRDHGDYYEPRFSVYFRFETAVKSLLRPGQDGIVLGVPEEALDQNVADELVETNVDLPWWWIHGRRFEKTDDAIGGSIMQEDGTYANGSDDWIPKTIKGPIKPVFWNTRRIQVTDNSGDHLTLDLDPPPDGHYGQILDHSHEVGPIKVVATSWGQLLQILAESLESGKFIFIDNDLRLVEEVERQLNCY